MTADLHGRVMHRSSQPGSTSFSSDLLGEILLRMTELSVMVGGGLLMITTHTLDVSGVAGLVMLCATWAVVGGVMGALQIEGPETARLAARVRRLPPGRYPPRSGALSLPTRSSRGHLSFPPPQGQLSLAADALDAREPGHDN